MIVELGTGAVVLGGAVHGAFHRNSFLFGRPITRLRGANKTVALTFDDGPNVDATPAILDALKRKKPIAFPVGAETAQQGRDDAHADTVLSTLGYRSARTRRSGLSVRMLLLYGVAAMAIGFVGLSLVCRRADLPGVRVRGRDPRRWTGHRWSG